MILGTGEQFGGVSFHESHVRKPALPLDFREAREHWGRHAVQETRGMPTSLRYSCAIGLA